MIDVTITREDDDRLARGCWRFRLWADYGHAASIVLERYAEEERKTRRHKYRPVRWYERLERRTFHATASIVEEQDVPLPDDIVEEAKAKVFEQLEVVRWEDFKR